MTYRDLKILYEDNHLLAVEKPVNVPSQGDSSGDADMLTLLKAYLKEKYQKPGEAYLGLVHRLDRPVGGAMVFAKTSKAASRLSQQIRDDETGKTYLTVVCGTPEPEKRLTDYLIKDPKTNSSRVCGENEGGKFSALNYRKLAEKDGLALLEVRLETGRSHQIRVQMAHAGHPIWGDNRYGGGKPGQQIALWCAKMEVIHPTLKTPVKVVCRPPRESVWLTFDGAIEALFASERQ